MAVTCLCDAYDSLGNRYTEYLAALELVNHHVTDLLLMKITEESYLAHMIKITDSCSLFDENEEYCDYLDQSLNGYAEESSPTPTPTPTPGSTSTAYGTFTNADLVTGVLTAAHNLDSVNVIYSIIDPAGNILQGLTVNVVSVNAITVDFGGAISSGTFKWIVISAE